MLAGQLEISLIENQFKDKAFDTRAHTAKHSYSLRLIIFKRKFPKIAAGKLRKSEMVSFYRQIRENTLKLFIRIERRKRRKPVVNSLLELPTFPSSLPLKVPFNFYIIPLSLMEIRSSQFKN